MSQKIVFAFVLAMAVAVLSAPSEKALREEALEQLHAQKMADEEPIPSFTEEEYVLEEAQKIPEENQEFVLEEVQDVEGRQPRVTCDLLSGVGWNHSFCAAHCIFKGYKGGACNSNGVCVCRR